MLTMWSMLTCWSCGVLYVDMLTTWGGEMLSQYWHVDHVKYVDMLTTCNMLIPCQGFFQDFSQGGQLPACMLMLKWSAPSPPQEIFEKWILWVWIWGHFRVKLLGALLENFSMVMIIATLLHIKIAIPIMQWNVWVNNQSFVSDTSCHYEMLVSPTLAMFLCHVQLGQHQLFKNINDTDYLKKSFLLMKITTKIDWWKI